jgi:MoaA/NifB/PqqE/SkfB family radical SAM enzyme
MSRYKVVVNLEWTNACNASCSMCPRSQIKHTENMTKACFKKVLERLNPDEVFRVVLAGYGEPTIHPQYDEFIDMLREHPVRFDLVSNGHAMDIDKLQKMDGAIDLLIVSFSSIVKEIYNQVHVRLNQKQVMENIITARDVLKKTQLAISLTPTTECLKTLPETIEWFHEQGINRLTMSPSLYNRAGSLQEEQEASKYLRSLIKKYGLRSQELEFIPSLWDNVKQIYYNKYNCIPRNVVMPIASNGDYQYCFNDMGRDHDLGNVQDMSLYEALRLREKTGPDPEICKNCNISNRYNVGEITTVVGHYFSQKQKGAANEILRTAG